MPKGDERYNVDDTHRDHEIEEMWAATTHVGRPIPELPILVRSSAFVRRVRCERGTAGGSSPGMGDEELRMFALDPCGVEPPRGTELVVDVTEQASSGQA